jgi:hypothetical protein
VFCEWATRHRSIVDPETRGPHSCANSAHEWSTQNAIVCGPPACLRSVGFDVAGMCRVGLLNLGTEHHSLMEG